MHMSWTCPVCTKVLTISLIITSNECFPLVTIPHSLGCFIWLTTYLLTLLSSLPSLPQVWFSPYHSCQSPLLVSVLHSLLTLMKQLVHGLSSVDITSKMSFIPTPLLPSGTAACMCMRSNLEGVVGDSEFPVSNCRVLKNSSVMVRN